MAFTEDLLVTAGNPTKKTDHDKVAANTDWLQDWLKVQHDLGVSDATGRHLDVTPLSDSAKDLGTAALRWRVVYADTLGDTDQALAITAGTNAINLTAGDLTLYDATNNADTSLSIGTSATERLLIQVLNGAANQSAESVNIVSQTAAAGANAGQITIGVDDATILTIDDGGINAILGATTAAAATVTTLTANTGIVPDANDGAYLGTTALGFSDLFLATGGVINWANGQVTITETDENTLTIAGVATRLDLAAGILEMNNAVEWDTGVATVAAEYSIGRNADATNLLQLNVPTGASFEFSVNDAAKVLIDAAGQLLVGHTASVAVGTAEPLVQIHTGTFPQGLYRWSADGNGPTLFVGKSRSATKGSFSAVVDNDVLFSIGMYGDDGTDLATIGASIVGRVNGTPAANDIPGEIELATYDGGAQTGSLILDAAGDLTLSLGDILIDNAAGAALSIDAGTGYDPILYYKEGGTGRYWMYYYAAGNYLALTTNDSDGGGTDADVIRIPDGGVNVQGNGNFQDGAFDVACTDPFCGWHGEDGIERCPVCGSPTEWHDDISAMRVLTRSWRDDPVVVRRLEQWQLIDTYGGKEMFVSMNRMPFFLMSGLVQERGLREQEEASLQEELALLKGRLVEAESELRLLRG